MPTFVSLLIDEFTKFGAEANDVDPERRDYLAIRNMLDPAPLAELVTLTDAIRFQVPGPPVESELDLLPGLVVLGADYEAERDVELGVLTSWAGFINGTVAARMTIEPVWFERTSTD